MHEISIEKIMEIANKMHKTKSNWHFHILLPTCKFNKKNKNALILETDTDTYITYSEKRYLREGEILVKLLYGNQILDQKEPQKEATEIVGKILEKANNYNQQNQKWEHHLLFPQCTLNEKKGKWVNVFETAQETIESVTEYEPKEDLKRIEKLYYKQKD